MPAEASSQQISPLTAAPHDRRWLRIIEQTSPLTSAALLRKPHKSLLCLTILHLLRHGLPRAYVN